MKQGIVYILASQKHGTLYVGITSNLSARVYQHKIKAVKGFTEKYNINKLVWFEMYDRVEDAIRREKQLKKWNRDWKIRLIEEQNPEWVDLYEGICA